jgi:predicted metal-dependent phosphoesterase TrpH
MSAQPYFADLHIHSCLSPCGGEDMTPSNIVKKLKMLDVNIFSIADHNSCGNSKAFSIYAENEGLLFVPGIELQTTEEVHLLGYFPNIHTLEEFYENSVLPFLTPGKNDPETFGKQIIISQSGKVKDEDENLLSLSLMIELDELIERIRAIGGLAVPAHLDKNFSIISQLAFIPPYLKVDAFEIYMIDKLQKIKKEYLQNRKEPIISSSDAHHPHHLIKPKMRFWLKRLVLGEIFEAFKGSEDRRITISQTTYSKAKPSFSYGQGKAPWE